VFDYRYHVASLTAVFVALVIGILVGVGLSGKGFVDDAERANLNSRIDRLERDRDEARQLLDGAGRRQQALEDFAERTYPLLVSGRLARKRVAVLFVGRVDQAVAFAVGSAVRDGGGTVVRTRSLRVPFRVQRIEDALARRPALGGYEGPDHLDDLGRDLGRELAAGGKTPLWDALGGVIVEERDGPSAVPADAVVLARPAPPQRGETKSVLSALYRGLARSGVPAVGVEQGGSEPRAVPAFLRGGLSAVDTVESPAGRLALVLLLAGAQSGSYGIEETATAGVLPPLAPAAEQP